MTRTEANAFHTQLAHKLGDHRLCDLCMEPVANHDDFQLADHELIVEDYREEMRGNS